MSSANHDAVTGGERVKVAIRMRPLNSRENESKVWKVSEKHNTIAETTDEGKPPKQRISNRNKFSFDKVFGEKSSTRDVYSNVAKGIVKSVMDGLNGTIFAYGQTSSGKTFTMQGSGTIEDGNGGGGGVLHMAARDIFSQISNDPERVFLLRVSFIEIYNEEVRDLLVTSGNDKVLKIREDPTRGVFVHATENIVTDVQSLLSTLFAGEKHRAFATTNMNERSSRSHTIFRITVESRKRKQLSSGDSDESEDDDEEFAANSVDNDDEAVRISTLNLVDLAGSESVKHTGATGERLIEGAKINQSLLTLSRVIAALGSPSRSHVNFRDSKLTRILQPSLSGNARMAIICCATPSEMYLEETRSTLQFASRAKLVKTNAQINEVLDERSMIKKLQRELADAKRAANGEVDVGQIRELKSEAAKAENVAKKVQEKYERLKASILKGGNQFLRSSTTTRDRKRRRQSDSCVTRHVGSPLLDTTNREQVLTTTTPAIKRKRKGIGTSLSSKTSESFQETLLRKALAAKGEKAQKLEREFRELRTKSSLDDARQESDFVMAYRKQFGDRHPLMLVDYIKKLKKKLTIENAENAKLKKDLSEWRTKAQQLESSNESLRKEFRAALAEAKGESQSLQKELTSKNAENAKLKKDLSASVRAYEEMKEEVKEFLATFKATMLV